MEVRNSARKKLFREIKGKVFFDELTRRIYAYSASICYLLPAAVVYPRDKNDVIKTIQIAAEEDIPITARGAGSGVAGQNLGEGIILDFSIYMNRILNIDRGGQTVELEPGVIRTNLNQYLSPDGLFFPPDPSSTDYATIGGMAANNSGGAHSLLYGTTKNYVKKLEVITANGEEIVLTCNGEAPEEYKRKVKELLRESAPYLKKNKPESFRNSCGYNLFEIMRSDGEINWTKLFCGSEGTLGVFTKIELDLLRMPDFRNSILLCYKDGLTAFSEVKDFLDLCPSTVQALAKEFLQLIATEDPEKYSRLPKGTDFILLVEFDGDDLEELNKKARELIKRSSAFNSLFAEDSSELAWVWEIRRAAVAYLSRLPGKKPTRWIEDGAVPVDKLTSFVLDSNNLLKKYKTSAALFGHAGQGLLHFSPRLNRMEPDFSRLIEDLGHEHALLSRKLKGVPSGEHGDGLLRTPYLKEIWDEVYPYFKKTKEIFDPNFRLNPLSIVSKREYKASEYLRFYKGYRYRDSGALNRLIDVIETCHGCGKCREFCPVTRSIKGEIGTPRARIVLLREIISGHIPEPFGRSDILEFFNMCLHCKTCQRECPSSVDVAKSLESYFEEKYLHQSQKLPDRILSKPQIVGKIAAKAGIFSKVILSLKPFRKLADISGLANLSYMKFEPLKPDILSLNKESYGKKVSVFSGCVGEFFNASEIKSALKLLERFGYQAELISGYCCGEPAYVRGFPAEGEIKLRESLERLKGYIETEKPVIFTSPSCMLPFVDHSEELLGKSGYEKAKKCFYGAESFFREQLLKYKDDLRCEKKEGVEAEIFKQVSKTFFYENNLKIAVQIPCHLKAIKEDNSLIEFLRMLPVADVIELKTNCCGFGGSRGFEKKWAVHADKIGEALADEILRLKPDIVVSPCLFCRIQIRKLLGVKALFSEKEDLREYILSNESKNADKIPVIHSLTLASEMLRLS